MDAARYSRQSWPDENRRFQAGYSWNVPDRPPGPAPQNRNRRPGWTPEAAAKQIGKQMQASTTAAPIGQQAIRLSKQWGLA